MSKTRPLKFSESSHISDWSHWHAQTYKSSVCRRSAAMYSENLLRSHSLAVVPGYAFMSGASWKECMFEAKRSENIQDETDERVLKLATRLYFHIHKTRTVADGSRDLRDGQSNAEITMSRTPTMRRALVGMLEGMIIQAWTAYEVLAEDLLEGVFKQRPKLNTQSTWTSLEQHHSAYRSRSKIANFYRWTFRVDNADILAVVDDSAIHALAVLRNSLVHCGGVIDETFQEDRLGFFKGVPPARKLRKAAPRFPIPELNRIKGRAIGYRIRFTGDMVRSFIDPVTPLGFSLVKAVDKWLASHR